MEMNITSEVDTFSKIYPGKFMSWDVYKLERNFYFREVARCKNEYLTCLYEKIDNEDLHQRSFFKLAKSFLSKTADISTPPLLSPEGILISDDQAKANAFNSFFSEASRLDDSSAYLPNDDSPKCNILDQILVSEEDVKDQIRLLDGNKSYGPDGISPKFIKLASFSLVKPLTKLFNLSLNKGKVPKLWKQANVVPIHKKDSKQILANYRPVSLLSILGKMMERIVFKYVFNHFRDNFLLSVWQSGFLPGSSTVTQLIEIYNTFCSAITKNKEIRIVFLDISKAFDRVWHKGLKFKLKKWGISGTLLTWFKDYLTDRFQRVIINGQFSEWCKISAGVPQGSVLGPLLFLVFINDITDVITNYSIRLFADDTWLFIEVDNREGAALLLNDDLKKIENWSSKWLVTFNPSKTESMIMGFKHHKSEHPKLYLHNTPIINVNKHKHIGLWLEDNLGWHVHVHDICTKAQHRLNYLKQLKFRISRNTLEKIYFTFIRPILEYGDVVWLGASHSDLRKIDSIQVEAMRLVSGAPFRSNISLLYNELGWQKLSDRREHHVLVMMFKIMNGLCLTYLRNLIPPAIGHTIPYRLRNSNNYSIPKYRINTHRDSFIPTGIKLWNQLDHSLKCSTTLSSFKYKLQKQQGQGKEKVYKFRKELFNIGDRFWNTIHARMRMKCSPLNEHLSKYLHVTNDCNCECGMDIENSTHFLFHCALHDEPRQIMMNKLSDLPPLSTEILLFGDLDLNFEQNKTIFNAVQTFFKETKHFK